jgi:uncharacterized protein (TIGR03067 family)
MTPGAVAVALAATLAACGGAAASPVEGSWSFASAKLGGTDVPLDLFHGPLQLNGGRYVFQNDAGTYVVNATVTPGTIDIHGEHGPNAGKTLPAIFAVHGDTLTICYEMSGKERPMTFTSDSGTHLFLARYTRSAK